MHVLQFPGFEAAGNRPVADGSLANGHRAEGSCPV